MNEHTNHIPYDQDFDAAPSSHSASPSSGARHGAGSSIHPKLAFYAGVACGVLGIGTIGFVVLFFRLFIRFN